MGRPVQQCQLPGCYEIVLQIDDGGPRRKYCCAAHRAAARRLRYTAQREAGQPVAVDQQESLRLLGVDQEEPCRPATEDQPEQAGPVGSPSMLAAQASTVKASRAQTSSAQTRSAKARAAAAKARAKAERRRRRAVAVLSAASVLVASAGVVVGSDPIGLRAADPARSGQGDAMVERQRWVAAAELALASLDHQLNDLRQLKARWDATAPAYRGELPEAVTALSAYIATLDGQRTALVAKLAAVRSLGTAQYAITETSGQIAAIDRALAVLGQGQPLTTAQQADRQRLLAERERLVQQLSRQRNELAMLDHRAQAAAAEPLPSAPDSAAVAAPVVELVERATPPPPAPASDPDPRADSQSAAIGSPEQAAASPPDTATSGSTDPGPQQAQAQPSGGGERAARAQPPSSSTTGYAIGPGNYGNVGSGNGAGGDGGDARVRGGGTAIGGDGGDGGQQSSGRRGRSSAD